MFEQEYQDTFSKVTASADTYRRVMNMAKDNKKHRRTGFASRVLIAAVLVSLLAVSASAAVENWFVTYFSNEKKEPLSQGQTTFIEENVQDISQRQTCNGYTIELKSVLTDGYNMFISLGITAPEGVYLDRTVKEGYDPAAPVIWLGNNSKFEIGDRGASRTWKMSDDGDGNPNTHNIVYLMSTNNVPFTEGETIQIHIEDIYAEYTNAAYGRELEEKYGSSPKLGLITNEEAEKLYPVELLAEGTWDFEIKFEKINAPYVEMINQPVDYVLEYETPDGKVTKTAKVLSVKLSAIGAVCTYEAGEGASISLGGNIFMKDGSKVPLAGNTVGSSWEGGSCGMFEVPIALEDVAYILFPDGTKITANS